MRYLISSQPQGTSINGLLSRAMKNRLSPGRSTTPTASAIKYSKSSPSGWEKAELGADDSRLYSWLRVGGHGAAHRQRRQALAASAFTCGLDRTVSSRWQEYVQQVLLTCRVGRKRDRVALEE